MHRSMVCTNVQGEWEMENREWGRAESLMAQSSSLVIPAQAGIYELESLECLYSLTPASAGVTEIKNSHLLFTIYHLPFFQGKKYD